MSIEQEVRKASRYFFLIKLPLYHFGDGLKQLFYLIPYVNIP